MWNFNNNLDYGTQFLDNNYFMKDGKIIAFKEPIVCKTSAQANCVDRKNVKLILIISLTFFLEPLMYNSLWDKKFCPIV